MRKMGVGVVMRRIGVKMAKNHGENCLFIKNFLIFLILLQNLRQIVIIVKKNGEVMRKSSSINHLTKLHLLISKVVILKLKIAKTNLSKKNWVKIKSAF